MNQNVNYRADYYADWTPERLDDIVVRPPYENKDGNRTSHWVRGDIRFRYFDSIMRDLVVTGPKMRVCYSGCRYNSVVFAMDTDNDEVTGFQRWLQDLNQAVRTTIWADPSKYKTGAVSCARFTFDQDIHPSKDPNLYPDEYRCKLAVKRRYLDNGEVEETLDTQLLDGNKSSCMNPLDVTAGSYIIPIIKFNYYRNGERFGMAGTVIKALVFPADPSKNGMVENKEWDFHFPVGMDETN